MITKTSQDSLLRTAVRQLFVGAVAALLLSVGSPAFADIGAWHIDESASALDGQQLFRAGLMSEGTVTDLIGRDRHAFLFFSERTSSLPTGRPRARSRTS